MKIVFEWKLLQQTANTFDDECRILTPQLTDPNYKDLQFAMKTTDFVQNDVIAQQSLCPIGLNLPEFIEFGSFRSGHCLQWWNLLSVTRVKLIITS